MSQDQTLSPAQLNQEAKTAYDREEYEQAARTYDAAERGFAAAGDTLNAAEMANNRSVSLLQAGDAQGALDAVGNTSEIFAEAKDTKRQAMALGNKAAALAELGQREEAEKLYWECARLLKEIGETDLRSSVLQAISRLQMRSGRVMEAVASMQSGLEQVEKPSWTQKLLKKILQVPNRMLNR
jgi:tetratricopeptide (TPR) repeat protein